MNRYSATIEILKSQRAAIVSLCDQTGEWACGGRIEVRSGSASDLYEAGYTYASLSATAKGGMLDRYTEVK